MENLALSPPWQKEDLIVNSKFYDSQIEHITKYSNNWDKLSDEIIIAIFSWLSKPVLCKISLVCHRFYTLSHDESLWNCIDLSCQKISLNNLLHLINLGLKTVKISRSEILNSYNISKDSTRFYIKRPGKLTHLDLSFTNLADNAICNILSDQFNITHLSLEDCKLNEKICSLISQNKELLVLNLSRTECINTRQFLSILISSPKLIELNLGWANMQSKCIQEVCKLLPHSLRRLNLSGNRESLLDNDILTIGEQSPYLEELDLSDCNQIGDESIIAISKSLSDLKVLSLSRCYKLDPGVFMHLKLLRKLKHLNIFNLLNQPGYVHLKDSFVKQGLFVEINQNLFSTIARPTTGINRTSIWKQRTRDLACL